MTVRAIGAADAERLFTVIRDTRFGWTVAEVPELMRILGWAISTEIPGSGAVARTPWEVPDADATLLYENGMVQSLTIRVTSRARDETADRFDVIDSFTSLSAIATRVLGPVTAAIPGDVPRTQWRRESATTTIQNVGSGVLVVWCRNEYQDFNDSIGRY